MPIPTTEPDTSFIKPRLRIFLSVDLIGSTQYKIAQTHGDSSAHTSVEDESWWPNVLMAFYTDFQKKFLENWQEWVAIANGWSEVKIGSPPKLWKALGDELLFSKICIHQNEVWGIIQVWRKTVNDFKRTWKYHPLKFKSGAWLVGSPVRNWEVAFLRDPVDETEIPIMDDRQAYNFHLLNQYYSDTNKRKIDIDFVGPSMDCGFRLLSKADERKFVISADLAYILRQSQEACGSKFKSDNYPAIEYYFDGVEELKGIARYGINYPIIWIDSFKFDQHSDVAKYARSVDKLMDSKPVEAEKFDGFLTTFLSDMEGFPELPYITDDQSLNDACPSTHSERIDKFRNTYKAAVERLKSIEANAIDPGTSGVQPTDDQTSAIDGVQIDPQI
jgi:hypothetical protein